MRKICRTRPLLFLLFKIAIEIVDVHMVHIAINSADLN